MNKARNRDEPRPTDAPARVMLVDDHPIVRFGFAQLIEDEPDMAVCGQAADAGDALKLIPELDPDLIVIDITLEGMNGIELIKQIHSRYDAVKMLVASMHDETLYAERALRAGAKGYVNKHEATTELVHAIRRVLKGKLYLSDRMTDRMMERAVTGEEEPTQSSIDTLSDRELEIFELLGRGMTARQIADKLHLSIKTVDTYRSHIKSKMKLKNNSELAVHAAKWVLEKE
jgi:DNA-binding NarL/FixJ family response regulator